MEHREAKRQNAAQRYMAGKLATAEREEFELHYFDCAECAETIRAMVRAGADSEAAGRGLWGWLGMLWSWRPRAAHILAPACIALAFVSYEAARARGQLEPQPVAAYHLLPEDARGPEQALGRSGSGEFVVLTAEVPVTVHKWQWQVRRSDGGGSVLEGVVSGPPQGVLNLLVPTRRLTAGAHVLTLRDANLVVPEITYRFRML